MKHYIAAILAALCLGGAGYAAASGHPAPSHGVSSTTPPPGHSNSHGNGHGKGHKVHGKGHKGHGKSHGKSHVKKHHGH